MAARQITHYGNLRKFADSSNRSENVEKAVWLAAHIGMFPIEVVFPISANLRKFQFMIFPTDPRSHAAGWPAFVMPLLMSQIAAHAPDGDISILIGALVHLSLATMVRS